MQKSAGSVAKLVLSLLAECSQVCLLPLPFWRTNKKHFCVPKFLVMPRSPRLNLPSCLFVWNKLSLFLSLWKNKRICMRIVLFRRTTKRMVRQEWVALIFVHEWCLNTNMAENGLFLLEMWRAPRRLEEMCTKVLSQRRASKPKPVKSFHKLIFFKARGIIQIR